MFNKFCLITFIFFIMAQSSSAKYIRGLGNLTCGQEGQPRCGKSKKEYWNNGSGGCDRGLKSRQGICKNKKRYSLKNYRWIANILKFQNEFQQDLPLNQIGFVGTHNSFNNKKDGYIFPNNIYSITDQLNLGARLIDLDVHWYNRRLRLCHGKKNHTGCVALDRLYHNAIEEINIWLNKNKDEVIQINIQKEFKKDKSHLFKLPLEHYFGDKILTSKTINLSKGWPSLREIKRMGKRVLIFGGAAPYNLKKIKRPGWPNHYVKYFNVKTCEFQKNGKAYLKLDPTFSKGSAKYWPEIGADSTKYLFFFDGAKKTGVFTTDVVKAATECNITGIKIEMLDPALAKAGIWTWAKGELEKSKDLNQCAMIKRDGRWYSKNCRASNHFACRSNKYPNRWKMTSYKGPFKQGDLACKREFQGYSFAVPMNGWENAQLYKNISKGGWIKFKNKFLYKPYKK